MPYLHMNKMESKNKFYGAGRMAQQLRASVVVICMTWVQLPGSAGWLISIYNSSSRDLFRNQSCT